MDIACCIPAANRVYLKRPTALAGQRLSGFDHVHQAIPVFQNGDQNCTAYNNRILKKFREIRKKGLTS